MSNCCENGSCDCKSNKKEPWYKNISQVLLVALVVALIILVFFSK